MTKVLKSLLQVANNEDVQWQWDSQTDSTLQKINQLLTTDITLLDLNRCSRVGIFCDAKALDFVIGLSADAMSKKPYNTSAGMIVIWS